jgi:uncharacterized RDD family membrane protein YckC
MTEQTLTTRYAGFWIRFVAHLIDTVVLSVSAWAIQMVFVGATIWIGRLFYSGWDTWSVQESFASFQMQMINLLIYLFVAAFYYSYGHYRWGMTLGKWPLGIRVVSESDYSPITGQQSVLRTLSYVVSYLPFLGGFIMAAFHPKKMGLHDVIAGTVSIRQLRDQSPALESSRIESSDAGTSFDEGKN